VLGFVMPLTVRKQVCANPSSVGEIVRKNKEQIVRKNKSKKIRLKRARDGMTAASARGLWGDDLVSRALKSQKLWLSLTYVGLILLMARVYS
jgi:hypothetical protein